MSARTDHGWRIGDRVSLCPNGREDDRVAATVTAIDIDGLPPGVRVTLDERVGGVLTAYASHDDLTLIERA